MAGVGDSLLRRVGTRLDSAPEVETLPISSWLKRAMQLTFPSSVGKKDAETRSAKASTAQNLEADENTGQQVICYYLRRDQIVHARAEDEFVVQSS